MKTWQIVRLVAGIFILLSLALGVQGSPIFVSPWWLAFTAFVGANLLQSALTQWCLMDSILRKMGATFSSISWYTKVRLFFSISFSRLEKACAKSFDCLAAMRAAIFASIISELGPSSCLEPDCRKAVGSRCKKFKILPSAFKVLANAVLSLPCARFTSLAKSNKTAIASGVLKSSFMA